MQLSWKIRHLYGSSGVTQWWSWKVHTTRLRGESLWAFVGGIGLRELLVCLWKPVSSDLKAVPAFDLISESLVACTQLEDGYTVYFLPTSLWPFGHNPINEHPHWPTQHIIRSSLRSAWGRAWLLGVERCEHMYLLVAPMLPGSLLGRWYASHRDMFVILRVVDFYLCHTSDVYCACFCVVLGFKFFVPHNLVLTITSIPHSET